MPNKDIADIKLNIPQMVDNAVSCAMEEAAESTKYWRDRAYALGYAIAGGEDAHDLIEATTTQTFIDMLATERAIAQEDLDYRIARVAEDGVPT